MELVSLGQPATPTIPSMEVYGHSIINDAGAPHSRYGFVSRLALMLAVPIANVTKLALSGGRVADQGTSGGVAAMLNTTLTRDLTAGPYETRGGLKICSIGANDRDKFNSSGASGSAVVEAAIRLAFSMLSSARVIPALASGSTLNDGAHSGPLTYGGGTWSLLADTNICLAPGEAYIGTNNAYVEFTLDAAYNGEAITAALVLNSFTDFLATLTVNGVTKATLDTSAMQAALVTATGLGASGGSPVGLRIPAGVASAGQTVRLTVSDMTGGKLAGVTGFLIEGHTPSPLILPTIPIHSGDTTQNDNAAYQKARVTAVAPEFPNAVILDHDALLPDSAQWSTTVAGHPNALGYEKIAEACFEGVRGLLLPDVVARMNA